MRNASGQQGENEWQRRKKKVNRNAYNISSIKRVLEVSRCSRAKQRQRNVQKKYAARAKCFFFLIRPTDVLGCFCCRHRLELHDFIFCLSKL